MFLPFKGNTPGDDKSYMYEGDKAEALLTVGTGVSASITHMDGRKFSIEPWFKGKTLLKEMNVEKLSQMMD